MNAKKFVMLALVLCLALTFCACRNAQPPVELPETHAGAINPDSVKSAQIIHYDENGNEDFNGTLDGESPFLPLLATVYDKASVTDASTKARALEFSITMTLEDGSVIALALYTDMTMDTGSVTLTARDMHDFLHSFVPIARHDVPSAADTTVGA